MKLLRNRRLILIVLIGLVAIGYMVFRVKTKNELWFLDDLHPQKITLHPPSNFDTSYVLLFPRETASQVPARLDRELLANGWRRTRKPGGYVYGAAEGLVAYRIVGPEPQLYRASHPFTMAPGTCYVNVCFNASWPIMMLRGWKHSH